LTRVSGKQLSSGTGAPLEGKVAWVTGGASGIGHAIVNRLRSMGAQVAILDLRRSAGLDPKEIVHTCDVSSRSSIDSAAQGLDASLGAPDILVNCAGASVAAPIANHDPAVWDSMLAVNLTGSFNMVRRVFSTMASRKWGRIVLTSSDAAFRPIATLGAYAASKAGVVALGRAVAAEGAPHGITCNILSPGIIDTPMTRAHFGTPEALQEAVTSGALSNPMGVMLNPDDLANAAAFLCHPDSQGFTGQILNVNAGSLMR
jgi:NAD(P)-dependent dehydrogenase (short-subunit alcohol dehydrogenase family)